MKVSIIEIGSNNNKTEDDAKYIIPTKINMEDGLKDLLIK